MPGPKPTMDADTLKFYQKSMTGAPYPFGLVMKGSAVQKVFVKMKPEELSLAKLKVLAKNEGLDGKVFSAGTCVQGDFLFEGKSQTKEELAGKKEKPPVTSKKLKPFVQQASGIAKPVRAIICPAGMAQTLAKGSKPERDAFAKLSLTEEELAEAGSPESSPSGGESLTANLANVDPKQIQAAVKTIWSKEVEPAVARISKMRQLFEAEGNDEDCTVAAEACEDLEDLWEPVPDDLNEVRQLIRELDNDQTLQILDKRMKIKSSMKKGLQKLEKLLASYEAQGSAR